MRIGQRLNIIRKAATVARPYLNHKPSCGVWARWATAGVHDRSAAPCTCGFSAVSKMLNAALQSRGGGIRPAPADGAQ